MSNDAKQLGKARVSLRELVDTLVESGQGQLDVVTDALDILRSEQSSYRPISRSDLIRQLRHAAAIAESPREDVVEFDIGDTDFTFDYSE